MRTIITFIFSTLRQIFGLCNQFTVLANTLFRELAVRPPLSAVLCSLTWEGIPSWSDLAWKVSHIRQGSGSVTAGCDEPGGPFAVVWKTVLTFWSVGSDALNVLTQLEGSKSRVWWSMCTVLWSIYLWCALYCTFLLHPECCCLVESHIFAEGES